MTLEQDLADLHALNARFIHNCITRDVASHDAINHPQFVCLSSNGKYTEKSAYLAYWATAFDPDVVIYWDTRDERISERSPDERSDIRVFSATRGHPACRFAHAGYDTETNIPTRAFHGAEHLHGHARGAA